jgi:hypothetical protein
MPVEGQVVVVRAPACSRGTIDRGAIREDALVHDLGTLPLAIDWLRQR